MCYLRPHKVKKIEGNVAVLENGIRAYYEKKVGTIRKDDFVIVYGNLILQKINEKSKQPD